jgi:hypothetical protein
VLNPGFASRMRTRRSLKRAPTLGGLGLATSVVVLLLPAAPAARKPAHRAILHARAWVRATEAWV